MTSLRDQAQAYQPKTTKNIAELPSVPIDIEIKDGKGIDKDSNEFAYKYLELNGEQYKVPLIVLGQLKDLLEANPNLKSFKVKRTGEGKVGTRYTVIPLS